VGRKLNVVGLIGVWSILGSSFALAQGKPQSFRAGRGGWNRHNGQFKGAARERWFQLSPEDRQTFRKNAERWLQMSPDERKLMRDREILRRERIRSEGEAVLRDSGLRLDQAKRDLFQERYLQERRRIDRELRQEYETKRQQQLERLKKEFQPPENSPGVSSTPAISTSPSR
jgi:hypothetical protein